MSINLTEPQQASDGLEGCKTVLMRSTRELQEGLTGEPTDEAHADSCRGPAAIEFTVCIPNVVSTQDDTHDSYTESNPGDVVPEHRATDSFEEPAASSATAGPEHHRAGAEASRDQEPKGSLAHRQSSMSQVLNMSSDGWHDRQTCSADVYTAAGAPPGQIEGEMVSVAAVDPNQAAQEHGRLDGTLGIVVLSLIHISEPTRPY